MKRTIILLMVFTLLLTACGGATDNTAELKAKDSEIKNLKTAIESLEKENEDLKKQLGSIPKLPEATSASELGIEEWWEVPGQWRLKIDSVTITEDRNQYSDKKPIEVVIIKYTYENTGYESDIQDLYFSPDNIIDGASEMGYTYPASTTTSPKPTPVGAKCIGAEDAYAYNNESDSIKIMFSKYDNSDTKQKMTFNVPVTK